MIKVAPSILAANPLAIGSDVRRMTDAGCDLIHVDVMDGHFVPNLSFGPDVVHALRGAFGLPLDVHLMLDNPEQYLRDFAKAGAWGITVHAEIPGDVGAILQEIRLLGCSAGLALRPGTPAEAVREFFPLADMMLVMTVEPGFGGQPFQSAMIDKVRLLREMGFSGLLEADGGVSLANLPALACAGLDVAVMGTAMYRSLDPKADIAKIHQM